MLKKKGKWTKMKGKMDEEENEMWRKKQIQNIGNVDLQWSEPEIVGVSSKTLFQPKSFST